MSSIYEALKRSQMNRPVESQTDSSVTIRTKKIYWTILAAIFISSIVTATFLYSIGMVGKVGTSVSTPAVKPSQPVQPQIPQQPQQLQKIDTERVIDLMNRADRIHNKGDINEAISIYTKVTSISPPFAEAYLKLGSLYYETKQYDKAYETYSNAIKIIHNDARLLNNIGSVLLAKGDTEKALDYFVQARRDSADYVEPLYNMACAYARLKKKDAALSSLRQACSMQPEAKLWASRDPDLAQLKGDKEFERIIRAQ